MDHVLRALGLDRGILLQSSPLFGLGWVELAASKFLAEESFVPKGPPARYYR